MATNESQLRAMYNALQIVRTKIQLLPEQDPRRKEMEKAFDKQKDEYHQLRTEVVRERNASTTHPAVKGQQPRQPEPAPTGQKPASGSNGLDVKRHVPSPDIATTSSPAVSENKSHTEWQHRNLSPPPEKANSPPPPATHLENSTVSRIQELEYIVNRLVASQEKEGEEKEKVQKAGGTLGSESNFVNQTLLSCLALNGQASETTQRLTGVADGLKFTAEDLKDTMKAISVTLELLVTTIDNVGEVFQKALNEKVGNGSLEAGVEMLADRIFHQLITQGTSSCERALNEGDLVPSSSEEKKSNMDIRYCLHTWLTAFQRLGCHTLPLPDSEGPHLQSTTDELEKLPPLSPQIPISEPESGKRKLPDIDGEVSGNDEGDNDAVPVPQPKRVKPNSKGRNRRT